MYAIRSYYAQEIIGIEYEGGGDPSLFPRSEQFIEQWTYNLGRGTLLKVLTFKGGILSSIEDGERIDGGGVPQKRYIFTLGEYSAEILDRITSYNVCYTKLLRSLRMAIHRAWNLSSPQDR